MEEVDKATYEIRHYRRLITERKADLLELLRTGDERKWCNFRTIKINPKTLIDLIFRFHRRL